MDYFLVLRFTDGYPLRCESPVVGTIRKSGPGDNDNLAFATQVPINTKRCILFSVLTHFLWIPPQLANDGSTALAWRKNAFSVACRWHGSTTVGESLSTILCTKLRRGVKSSDCTLNSRKRRHGRKRRSHQASPIIRSLFSDADRYQAREGTFSHMQRMQECSSSVYSSIRQTPKRQTAERRLGIKGRRMRRALIFIEHLTNVYTLARIRAY